MDPPPTLAAKRCWIRRLWTCGRRLRSPPADGTLASDRSDCCALGSPRPRALLSWLSGGSTNLGECSDRGGIPHPAPRRHPNRPVPCLAEGRTAPAVAGSRCTGGVKLQDDGEAADSSGQRSFSLVRRAASHPTLPARQAGKGLHLAPRRPQLPLDPDFTQVANGPRTRRDHSSDTRAPGCCRVARRLVRACTSACLHLRSPRIGPLL